MDLNFSPDWPAWLCYLIVLLFGVLTGWREVVEKIDDVSGVWRQTATWALMLIIGVSPVLLFWLLDRVGALHDTSAIAAAIVGVAYTQILKGDSEYKAPGSTSPIWNFLSWWRERIAKAVQDRAANNALAFDQAVCERLADPAKLASATALALKLTGDPVKFQVDLSAERARLAAASPALDATVIDYKIAELVYREIQADPGDRKLMVTTQLIDKALVDEFFSNRFDRLMGGAILLAIVAAGALAIFGHKEISGWIEREYLLGRLSKPNGTVSDLDRVTTSFSRRMGDARPGSTGNRDSVGFWLEPLPDVLRDSTLPMSRIDAVLQVALVARDKEPNLGRHLAPALRSGNVDARRRVQLALVYLTEGKKPEPAVDLKGWNPTEGDSITDIERRIDAWRAYWSSVTP